MEENIGGFAFSFASCNLYHATFIWNMPCYPLTTRSSTFLISHIENVYANPRRRKKNLERAHASRKPIAGCCSWARLVKVYKSSMHNSTMIYPLGWLGSILRAYRRVYYDVSALLFQGCKVSCHYYKSNVESLTNFLSIKNLPGKFKSSFKIFILEHLQWFRESLLLT